MAGFMCHEWQYRLPVWRRTVRPFTLYLCVFHDVVPVMTKYPCHDGEARDKWWVRRRKSDSRIAWKDAAAVKAVLDTMETDVSSAGEEQESFKSDFGGGILGHLSKWKWWRNKQPRWAKKCDEDSTACSWSLRVCPEDLWKCDYSKCSYQSWDEQESREPRRDYQNIMKLLCFAGREKRKGTKGSVWRLRWNHCGKWIPAR